MILCFGSPAEVHQLKLREQIEVLRAEFVQNHTAILKSVRDMQAADDHAAAMKAAARYFPLGDSELNALYRTSANAESQRQQLAEFRESMRAECTEETARRLVPSLLPPLTESAKRQVAKAINISHVTRLPGVEAQALLKARLAERASSASQTGRADHDEQHHDKNHPHNEAWIPPALGAAIDGKGDDDLFCAWKIGGERRVGKASHHFETVLWLLPHPSGKMTQSELLSYSEK